MNTDLRAISQAVAAALGSDWHFEPGKYDHFCHLVHADGLTLWVRLDPNKPGRLLIRCDPVQAVDIYGHPAIYSSDTVPAITAAATRTPASIAADIRSRLLADAAAWHTKALAWQSEMDAQFAVVEKLRCQLLALPGARPA